MKALCLTLVILFGLLPFSEVKLTEEERAYAIEVLTSSRDQLLRTVEGLSDEQLNFKPDAQTWSVADGVEHLAISENAFNQMITNALATSADPSRRIEVKMKDDELMGIIRDRTNRVKTSETFEPSGKFGSYEETLEALISKRKEHLEYIEVTEDDLRFHYGQLPFGTVDAYQMILFMAGHTDRHIAQMEEVINHEDFPE